MQHFLPKEAKERLGAQNFESFTNHPFFYPIDFEALEEKRIRPIFKPREDKTNFDATHDLEELLLEEAPLEARTRNQKPRRQLKVGATAQEVRDAELHQMIERYFEPFDYTIASYDSYVSVAVAIRLQC